MTPTAAVGWVGKPSKAVEFKKSLGHDPTILIRFIMKNYTIPEFEKKSFHCPFCSTYAHMKWTTYDRLVYYARCSHCEQFSLWRIIQTDEYGNQKGEMMYPDFGLSPLPEMDMPDDVKQDYEEAARIFSKSPRGAAALLRLGLQKLCVHLGEEGKNINTDIRKLVEKGIFSGQIIKVADTLRITGNNAVHPAQISNEDFDEVAGKIFDLINFIVKKAITEPKELDALYNKMPENARKAAEQQDAKSVNQPS